MNVNTNRLAIKNDLSVSQHLHPNMLERVVSRLK